MANKNETIIFGGGCFWCTEAVFLEIKGVKEVTSGYAGGDKPNPTYEEVCSGLTGHAEVVKIDFDSNEISLEDVLTVFFATHDPTTVNRQGNDVGSQYRSIILAENEAQKEEVQKFIKDLANQELFNAPIVTEIDVLKEFYPAEEYHQRFYQKNPDQGYCQAIINPKLKKLKARLGQLLKRD
ncbi:MAG: peptide-methionine (S)-S-oxide reductase MsrA [Acidobacteriaceae bacterium]